MIELSNVSFSYPGSIPAVSDVMLSIGRGEYIAVLGANGSGKTTLALLVKGLLESSSGAVAVDGIPAVSAASRHEVMRRVGLVFQNPDDTFVATTVERELAFGMENIGLDPRKMHARINEALERYDLARYCHANPTRLSGGEKQRLALAAVMVMRPEILILDEPTSLLDPWSRDSMLAVIHDAACSGTTVIHITQFTSEASRADRIVILDRGRVCADGTPGDVLSGECGFLPGCSISDLLGRIDGNTGMSRQDEDVARQRKDASSDSAVPVLKCAGISHVHEGGGDTGVRALDDVTVSFRSGEVTALVGPAGAGKTTLLEIVAGVTVPTDGTVAVNGGTVRAMAFQFPEDQMYGDTVADYIVFGPRNRGASEDTLPGIVDHALETVGLDPERYRGRDPLSLSGGEKRRAAIAGILALSPKMLIFDEPTAGLDRNGVERMIAVMDAARQTGCAVVFATHDFDVAETVADRVLVLSGGKIVRDAPSADVFADPSWLTGPESLLPPQQKTGQP